jgi:hypothetical protein
MTSRACTTSVRNVPGARRPCSAARASSTRSPFDVTAARAYGRVAAAVIAAGCKPHRRVADLMIAATAIAEDLPLFTTSPDDYAGLERLVRVIPVTRPHLPHEKKP